MRTFGYLLLTIILLSFSATFAQDMDFFQPKTTIGGYGELHYNYSKPENGPKRQEMDFHRFVLFFNHAWTEKWSFKSEVEFEHNFVRGGQGEIKLEQAFVNYHHADYFGFQAGVVLNAVGLLNEWHEPPLFLSVERPDYQRIIVPTTWFGNGAALYGTHSGLEYKVTVMEGLSHRGFVSTVHMTGIRGGRQNGYYPNVENLLYNAKVDYLGIPYLRAGASVTHNKAFGNDTLAANSINLVEFHAQYTGHNLFTNFEYGNISYETGNVKASRGYYIDLGYNVLSFTNTTARLYPFARYSDLKPAAELNPAAAPVSLNGNFTEVMFGISYLPISEVVFKIDYSQRKRTDGLKTELVNLGVGYMF
jgi:opacity protein-like surface antigen